MYGSPYGGATITRTPQFQIAPQTLRDRPQSEDVMPEDDLDLRMRARIINDILKGKINVDDLNRFPGMQPAESSLQYFNPTA